MTQARRTALCGVGRVVASVFLLSGCSFDPVQAATCERVLWLVIDVSKPGQVTDISTSETEAFVITFAYSATHKSGRAITGFVRCRFAGGGFGKERVTLVGVWTDDAGELSPFSVAHLNFLLETP